MATQLHTARGSQIRLDDDPVFRQAARRDSDAMKLTSRAALGAKYGPKRRSASVAGAHPVVVTRPIAHVGVSRRIHGGTLEMANLL